MTQCLTDSSRLSLPKEAKEIIETLVPNSKGGYSMGSNLPVITEDLQKTAMVCIERIAEKNKPCDLQWFKGAIYTLLQHFYTKDLPENVQTAIAQDWMMVLSDMPQWAIEKARIDFLKNNNRRPSPNEIRDLCVKAMSKDVVMVAQCKKIISMDVHVECTLTMDEKQAMIDEINKKLKAKKM